MVIIKKTVKFFEGIFQVDFSKTRFDFRGVTIWKFGLFLRL